MRTGEPLGLIAELQTAWVSIGTGGEPPGYACVVYKPHVEEPYELPAGEGAAFWSDVMEVARALAEIVQPRKMNYEIHGNTIPHLHAHLLPQAPTGEVRPAELGERLGVALR